MTQKYCSSCNSTKPIDGGQTVSFRHTNGTTRTRWRCAACANAAETLIANRSKITKPVEDIPK